MSLGQMKDIGAVIKNIACGGAIATAAGTGDGTAVTGASIDRKPKGGIGFGSCTLALAYLTTLAAAKTLAFQVEVQESADDGAGAPASWETATVLQASTVQATGALTASVGILEIKDTGFSSRKQWVRYNFTPELSNTATDTVVANLVATFGGPDSMPA